MYLTHVWNSFCQWELKIEFINYLIKSDLFIIFYYLIFMLQITIISIFNHKYLFYIIVCLRLIHNARVK